MMLTISILVTFLCTLLLTRQWFLKKYKSEISTLKTKCDDLEHEYETTIKAKKVVATGVLDPTALASYKDGVAKLPTKKKESKSIKAKRKGKKVNLIQPDKKEITKKSEPLIIAVSKKKKVNEETQDDFTLIEGIGPKIRAVLNNAGIISFEQLAAYSSEDIKKIIEQSGSRYSKNKPDIWIERAYELAVSKEWRGAC